MNGGFNRPKGPLTSNSYVIHGSPLRSLKNVFPYPHQIIILSSKVNDLLFALERN